MGGGDKAKAMEALHAPPRGGIFGETVGFEKAPRNPRPITIRIKRIGKWGYYSSSSLVDTGASPPTQTRL